MQLRDYAIRSALLCGGQLSSHNGSTWKTTDTFLDSSQNIVHANDPARRCAPADVGTAVLPRQPRGSRRWVATARLVRAERCLTTRYPRPFSLFATARLVRAERCLK